VKFYVRTDVMTIMMKNETSNWIKFKTPYSHKTKRFVVGDKLNSWTLKKKEKK
jgi:hypothetical protein